MFYGIFFTLNSIMTNYILQWNCRSVKANVEELNLLLHLKKPVAVCLQHTFLRDSDKFSLKHNSCYFKHCGSGDKASGGVQVIVNNTVPHHSARLDSHLQAVAVTISLNKTITLCSVFLPPRVLGLSLTTSSGYFRGSVLGQDTSEPTLVLVKTRKA